MPDFKFNVEDKVRLTGDGSSVGVILSREKIYINHNNYIVSYVVRFTSSNNKIDDLFFREESLELVEKVPIKIEIIVEYYNRLFDSILED